MSQSDLALSSNTSSSAVVVESEPPTLPAPTTAATSARSGWLDSAKWVISFPAMLAVCLIGRIFYSTRAFAVDPDLWWHIKVGQDILRTHHFPTTDPYSWTVVGQPWIAYEWLGEVALALVEKAGGVLALSTFLFVLSSVVILAIYALATIRAKNSKAAFVSTLALTTIAVASFSERPQMFGYLFLVLTMIVMEKFREGVIWPLWTLPVMFLAWVNIHGSFIIGIGVMVLTLLAGLFTFRKESIEAVAWTPRQRMQLELAILLCLAVLPITPYGTQLAVYPFDMATAQPINVANVMEWQPMPFALAGGKIFLGLIVLFFLLQILFRFTWRLDEMILAIGGAVMACLHVRFILLFVPFYTPLFAVMLARWIPAYKRPIDKYALNAALMATAIIAMVHYRPTQKSLDEAVGKVFPAGALQYLQQHPAQGKMLNTYGAGGYMVKAGIPTFVDGRGDLFERGGVFGDYMHLMRMTPGGFSVLKSYDISVCLLERDEPLSVALAAMPGWQRVYVDGSYAVFERRETAK
jgi:hypothetical protein